MTSAALRGEYEAQGYDPVLWDGLKDDLAALPEVTLYLNSVLIFLGVGDR